MEWYFTAIEHGDKLSSSSSLTLMTFKVQSERHNLKRPLRNSDTPLDDQKASESVE